jgi:hypothetical protein
VLLLELGRLLIMLYRQEGKRSKPRKKVQDNQRKRNQENQEDQKCLVVMFSKFL